MNDYKQFISIADIVLELQSSIQLIFQNEILCFKVDDKDPDIKIKVLFSSDLPPFQAQLLGNDGMFDFYDDGHYCYEKPIEGVDGSVSLVVYTKNFKECTLYINEDTFPDVIRDINKALQLLPMKQMLTYYQVLMLHSSRIWVNNISILFTAPSQTGKTTQSKLWCQYEDAKIVSNDRSLIRKINDTYYTYGYPVDGSSPIYSNEKIELGAIVVLRQDRENKIEKLSIQMALKYMMEQTAYDSWSSDERIRIMQLWLDILEKCPVYMLRCKPDKEAVDCLKQQLIKDGVINNGK